MTRFQVALAWVLREPGIVAIPKAGSRPHVEANRGALDLHLTAEDLARIDDDFSPPRRKSRLAVL